MRAKHVAVSRIAAFRSGFPGTTRLTYLDVAARCILSTHVREAIEADLDERMYEGARKTELLERIERTRGRFARLIGAEPDEIAFTRNVSDGISAFACALPWREGDNVVVCEALEHPANIMPWYGLRTTRGIGVKVVVPVVGEVPLQQLADAIDARTRVVTVSSVSFSPGFRFPIAELGALCRRKGALLLVDGAQSVGILDTDVGALGVDALVTSTQKGLLGPYGMGFLFIRRAVAETLHPAYLSRFGLDLEGAHEATSGDPGAYRLAKGARRFDVGNYNYSAAAAVDRSIADLLEIGMVDVEAHACGLAREFAGRFIELGLPVFGGPDHPARAHIVAVGHELSGEHDATGNSAMRSLSDALTRADVRHTIRRGLLRFSFHVYNDASDVERAVLVAREWTTRRRNDGA